MKNILATSIHFISLFLYIGMMCLFLYETVKTISIPFKKKQLFKDSLLYLIKYFMFSFLLCLNYVWGFLTNVDSFLGKELAIVTPQQQIMGFILEYASLSNLLLFSLRSYYIKKETFRLINILIFIISTSFYCGFAYYANTVMEVFKVSSIDLIFIGNSMNVERSLLNTYEATFIEILLGVFYILIYNGLLHRFKVRRHEIFSSLVAGFIFMNAVMLIRVYGMPPQRPNTLSYFSTKLVLILLFYSAVKSLITTCNTLIKQNYFGGMLDEEDDK